MSQVTLEEVAAQFALWRSTRTHLGKTPDHLKKLIHQLTPIYPRNQVLKTLKIHWRFLDPSCKYTKTPVPASDKHELSHLQFTPLNLHLLGEVAAATPISPSQYTCQITKNGATLSITTNSCETILQQFLCYS